MKNSIVLKVLPQEFLRTDADLSEQCSIGRHFKVKDIVKLIN